MVKLTKNQLKEWIKEDIQDFLSEAENGGGDKESEGPKQASTDIADNPFNDDEEEEKEDMKESLDRRVTVKEIKKWFKTLEENRYKRTYHSDARRVSWLVNNSLSEDYESMPISMRKKWSKAAYGRERHLAKEFIKHRKAEARLRESIRTIIKRLI